MFDKKLETNGNMQTIKLIGDLDVYSEDDFKSFIDEKIDVNKDIIVDLDELEYLDSTGLGMFMSIYKMLDANGKSIKIINAKENIKNNQKTDDIIKNLQNQIDNLKQQEQNKADSKLTQFYQDQVNKLKEANNAQQNNANENKVNALLDDVNNKVDDIKKKLNSILGNNN